MEGSGSVDVASEGEEVDAVVGEELEADVSVDVGAWTINNRPTISVSNPKHFNPTPVHCCLRYQW